MKIGRFDFTGPFGRSARCGLERIDLADGRVVIIGTELPDNPGISVTNWAEELATQVCAKFTIDPDRLVWIEHYPAEQCPRCGGSGRHGRGGTCLACRGRGKRRELPTFDLVTFTAVRERDAWRLVDPQWRPMREADWVQLGLSPPNV